MQLVDDMVVERTENFMVTISNYSLTIITIYVLDNDGEIESAMQSLVVGYVFLLYCIKNLNEIDII